MSTSQVQPQAGHLDQLSDAVAVMVAHLLQEQLAPIVDTLREHARLLDFHTALLNHSTIMSRYNVGKLDDLRDLQNSVKRETVPHVSQPPTPSGVRRTATVVDVASSLLGDCPCLPDRVPGPSGEPSSSQSTEPTNPPPTTNAPNVPARQATLPTESATIPPPSPMAAPSGNRRLQRERRVGEAAGDPMWTTSRAIDIDARLPTPPPPPPYVLPPAYTDEDNAGVQNIVQATTTTATTTPRTSPPRSVPPAPAAGAEQAATPTPSANTQIAAAIVNVNGQQSQSTLPSSSPTATASRSGAISDDGPCADPSSQLSDRAAGKKRRRDDDNDNESDDAEASPGASGSGSQSRYDEPEYKRVRMDPATSTKRLPIPEILLNVARKYPYPEPTLKERRVQFERLKSLRSMFRRGGGASGFS
ncbi:hypothetical protein BJV78DRAFT_1150608 [Lactifluus subvellereus]|nr:hypothetical protein BJV78DRAFT_1150608 [Lactifluus subvellereus]